MARCRSKVGFLRDLSDPQPTVRGADLQGVVIQSQRPFSSSIVADLRVQLHMYVIGWCGIFRTDLLSQLRPHGSAAFWASRPVDVVNGCFIALDTGTRVCTNT